jgi:hypothetical protein
MAAAGMVVAIQASSFTLSWTHTVEKTEWHEEWDVEGDSLVLSRALVKGSGAGIDPPPNARLEDGFYVWQPNLSQREVIVRRDRRAGDWQLCAAGRCAMLGEWVGRDADPVHLRALTAEEECEGIPPAP